MSVQFIATIVFCIIYMPSSVEVTTDVDEFDLSKYDTGGDAEKIYPKYHSYLRK